MFDVSEWFISFSSFSCWTTLFTLYRLWTLELSRLFPEPAELSKAFPTTFLMLVSCVVILPLGESYADGLTLI